LRPELREQWLQTVALSQFGHGFRLKNDVISKLEQEVLEFGGKKLATSWPCAAA